MDNVVKIIVLSNPGTADDLMIGKSLIDKDGNVVTGKHPIPAADIKTKEIIYKTVTEYDNSSIKSVGNFAFYGCYNLSSVNISKCTTIGNNAFAYCSKLTTANFPVCTSIGNNAFYSCSKLTSLTLGSTTVCTLSNSTAFYNTPMSNSTYTGNYGSIYVPASLVSAYKSSTNWSYYSSRITSI